MKRMPKTIRARLIRVGHQGGACPYEVSIRFKFNIVHGVITHELSFTQKRWPKSLNVLVNREINAPFFVECSTQHMRFEEREVTDGYESFTVIDGCSGVARVLGLADTKTSFMLDQYPMKGMIKIKPRAKLLSLFSEKERWYRTPLARTVSLDLGETFIKNTHLDVAILSAFRHELKGISPSVSQTTRPLIIDLNTLNGYEVEQARALDEFYARRSALNEGHLSEIISCQRAILKRLETGQLIMREGGYVVS